MRSTRSRLGLVALPIAAMTLSLAPGVAHADNGTTTQALRDAVTVGRHHDPPAGPAGDRERQRRHARSRDTGARGVRRRTSLGCLQAAGYTVTTQPFSYDQFIELSAPELDQVSPDRGDVHP